MSTSAHSCLYSTLFELSILSKLILHPHQASQVKLSSALYQASQIGGLDLLDLLHVKDSVSQTAHLGQSQRIVLRETYENPEISDCRRTAAAVFTYCLCIYIELCATKFFAPNDVDVYRSVQRLYNHLWAYP
jgi:hypothetical protein